MGRIKKPIDKTKVFNVPMTYELCETICFAINLGRMKAIDTDRFDLDDQFGEVYLKFIDAYRKAYKSKTKTLTALTMTASWPQENVLSTFYTL